MEIKKSIEGKKLITINVYIGNMTEPHANLYVKKIARRFKKLNEYDDVIVFFNPTRELTKLIEVIHL